MIKTKENQPRKALRIGIGGRFGLGKSTAIFRMFKNPIMLDLEEKLPALEAGKGQIVDLEGRPTFAQVRAKLKELLAEPSLAPHDGLALDTTSKLEEWMTQHSIAQDYEGKKTAFSSYSSGAKNELPDYMSEVLDLLQLIQNKHGIAMLLICHAVPKLYRNPLGSDYDKMALDLQDKCASRVLKWCDFFGFVYDDVQSRKEGLRVKAKEEGVQRMISFDASSPLFDAKAIWPVPSEVPFDIAGKWVSTIFKGAINNG